MVVLRVTRPVNLPLPLVGPGVRSPGGRVGLRTSPVAPAPQIVASLEAVHQRVIAENPVDLYLRRTVRRDDGEGGLVLERSLLGPFTVRIYQERPSTVWTTGTEPTGARVDEPGWGLIGGADLVARGDPLIGDTLETPEDYRPALGATFQIVAVVPLVYANACFGVRCALVRVGPQPAPPGEEPVRVVGPLPGTSTPSGEPPTPPRAVQTADSGGYLPEMGDRPPRPVAGPQGPPGAPQGPS